jgi:hypothetical protein
VISGEAKEEIEEVVA